MSGSRPSAYTIRREGLRLDIALVETGRLLLHEETIPETLEALQERIREDGMQRSPVIVDRRSLVVLDGMHRVTALKNLGCHFTCACLVDYRSPEITVDRWCRVIPRNVELGELIKEIEERGMGVSPSQGKVKGAGIKLVKRGRTHRVIVSEPGVKLAYKAVAEIELWLRARGIPVGYEAERDAMEKMEKGEVDVVLCPPKISKQEILDTAGKGEVFPSKATRHVVPARPVGVDVPLSLLRNAELSLEEANRRLSEMLQKKVLRRVPPGSLRGGRRYEEELYVFEDV